jgi:hypothetical protein
MGGEKPDKRGGERGETQSWKLNTGLESPPTQSGTAVAGLESLPYGFNHGWTQIWKTGIWEFDFLPQRTQRTQRHNQRIGGGHLCNVGLSKPGP